MISVARKNGKGVAATLLIIGIIVLVVLAVRFVHHRLEYAVTDAVFVRTDSLATLGFDRVSGRILTMTKKAGDPVAADEILATLDDANYRLEAERLAAELDGAVRERERDELLLERLKQEIPLDEQIATSRLAQLRKEEAALAAQASASQAAIEQLERDRQRYIALLQDSAVSKRQLEDTETSLKARQEEKKGYLDQAAAIRASLKTAELQVALAKTGRSKIQETSKDLEAQSEKIKGLTAASEQARRDLEGCTLKSPGKGRIAKRFVSPGDIVTPESAIYALVDPSDVHIVALLEENKLQGVEPGATATIKIDAYPDRQFSGVVRQVLPASAATFALAPRDISAGEFTKVAQRIPVRIEITDGDTSLLHVGLGGEVEIKRVKGGS